MNEIIETIKSLETAMKWKGMTDEKIEISISSIPEFGEIFKKIKRDRDCRGDDERGDRDDGRSDRDFRVEGVRS